MRPAPAVVFRRLSREALADALRRRIVPGIAALALLSLLFVDTCSSCSPVVMRNGEPVSLPQVAGFGGLVMAVLLGLWAMVLAGVLASDHLAEPLADGSAELVLARPVSRDLYALSRLLGAWSLAGATGLLLLGAAAVLLQLRQGIPAAPVWWAGLACLSGAGTVAALAMTASLWLPRTLTAGLAFAAVWGLAIVNTAAQLGARLGPVGSLVEHLGPPLASALIRSLAPWIASAAPVQGEPLELALRSLAWLAGSAGCLVLAFRSVELPR